MPASPEHIAARVRRLELSTRFRPVHISVLFVALAPAADDGSDFYAAPEKSPVLSALGISAQAGESSRETVAAALLAEFQRRGYHLAYLSECPAPAKGEIAPEAISKLTSTLLRRIRFNYKPKLIAALGMELDTVMTGLREAGIGPLIAQKTGQPLPVPRAGDPGWLELFQGAVTTAAPRDNLCTGYDRISVSPSDQELEAGGNS